MRCQRKGGLSATTQVKVLSPEIDNIALGQRFHVLEASIATCVKCEYVSGVPGSELATLYKKDTKGGAQRMAPVVQLVTPFGGGKTHSLLALYHLTRHYDKIKSLEQIKDALRIRPVWNLLRKLTWPVLTVLTSTHCLETRRKRACPSGRCGVRLPINSADQSYTRL